MGEGDVPTDASSILHESEDGSVVVLDIPRSIEDSQALPGHRVPARRLVSAQPLAAPFDLPEPIATRHHPTPAAKSPAAQIADLMTGAAVLSALDHLGSLYPGPLHLPRVVVAGGGSDDNDDDEDGVGPAFPEDAFIPDQAVYVCDALENSSRDFLGLDPPAFDLIILDPPWPNRSARRNADGYATVRSLDAMGQLLSHVPVPSHLAPNGLVAIWITNKSSILDFVTSPAGLFSSWGLELVAEWTWLKVTSSGQPIFDVDATWRKPWEKLLIAKRRGAPTMPGLRSRTIVAVPDLHSRKPNLRGLFAGIFGPGLRGLEVFARNLTAGWWHWGMEVLLFQQPHHWATPSGHF